MHFVCFGVNIARRNPKIVGRKTNGDNEEKHFLEESDCVLPIVRDFLYGLEEHSAVL